MKITPPPTPFFRPARLDDANCLAVLALQVWLHTYATAGISENIADYVLAELTPTKFSSLISDPLRHVIVIEKDNNLLGFSVINSVASCPYGETKAIELATLYVQEHFIGSGLGSALIQASQEWAQSMHQCVLWLKVNAQNQRAIRFYQLHGYSKLGSVDFVLGEQRHENFVMRKEHVNKQ